MEHLKGAQHPAVYLKKCPECNFMLKNQLNLGTVDQDPYWDLFCPNLTCPNFGIPLIRYTFESDHPIKQVDDTLIDEVAPDTSIESD